MPEPSGMVVSKAANPASAPAPFPVQRWRRWVTAVTALALALVWVGVLAAMSAPELGVGVADRMLGLAILVSGLGMLGWRIVMHTIAQIALRDGLLRQASRRDGLTGLLNHAGFFEVFDRDFARSKRYGHEFSLMQIEIDFFRRINDGYGRQIGDQVIQALAGEAVAAARTVDAVGRLSGASFAIAMPETPLAATHQLAERLRERLAAVEVDTVRGEKVRFTVSIGVASLTPVDEQAEQLMQRAVRALQTAQDLGRNRVEAGLVGSQETRGVSGNPGEASI